MSGHVGPFQHIPVYECSVSHLLVRLVTFSIPEGHQPTSYDGATLHVLDRLMKCYHSKLDVSCYAATGEPSGELKAAIDKAFGSFEDFKKEFSTAGATQFGSGWAWLVKDGGALKVVKTPNAENPLHQGQVSFGHI